MAVKIRLRRMGQKKAPSIESSLLIPEPPRDGHFIEEIGTYDPSTDPSDIQCGRGGGKEVACKRRSADR